MGGERFVIVPKTVYPHINSGIYDIGRILDKEYSSNNISKKDMLAFTLVTSGPLGEASETYSPIDTDTYDEVEWLEYTEGYKQAYYLRRKNGGGDKVLEDMRAFIKIKHTKPGSKLDHIPSSYAFSIRKIEGGIAVLPRGIDYDVCPGHMTYFEYKATALLIGYKYGWNTMLELNNYGFSCGLWHVNSQA